MSVFTEDQATTPESQTNQTQEGTNQSFVELVVKEKGEQWSDPEALAKGYYHAQQRIKELEGSRSNVEDFSKQLLEALQAQTAPKPAPAPVQTNGDSGEENTTPKPEDLKSLIEETITSRERQRTVTQNVQEVETQLNSVFGTEAKGKVKSRAQELGLSLERMQEIAGESPSAFMSLMGQAPVKQTNTVPTSTVNVSPKTGERDFAYYMKLKKENPRQFWSPSIQRMMIEDKLKMGDSFGN